ncbi:MAG: hypothetical protein A3D10_06645 [Omnitrophica WOR_2 bacterium RIFCSPHIGHO2_02_FULL_48_11]|nr:MAG: hypothetical protein A3D10_06645 [Omnitrophica WOR_2 bacterium RIFCSPHIGHO2_02_FULL_48_11]
MLITIFWISIFLVFYCYLGYPVALKLMALFLKRAVKRAEFYPKVSIILSLWNEADVIEAKIKNLLSLDYPAEHLEIWAGSDGSTDRTVEIIKQFSDPRVHLLEQRQRQGKAQTINALLKCVKSDIVIFTDARQPFAKNALKELVQNFSDPTVGCVSGELVFSPREGATARGISLYWKYEKFIRAEESKIHSMLGATGAIYAIRRELFTEIPEKVVLDDMFVPLKIIEKGFRAIFDEQAKAYDEVADQPREEYRRKARTLYGNYQIFFLLPQMFNPLRSPVALQLFSHKFLRVVAPILLGMVFLINIFLADQPIYAVTLILQMIFYLLALIGGLARHQKHGILKGILKICYIPYVFCLLNFSALAGLLRFMSDKQDAAWQKARDNTKG